MQLGIQVYTNRGDHYYNYSTRTNAYYRDIVQKTTIIEIIFSLLLGKSSRLAYYIHISISAKSVTYNVNDMLRVQFIRT